MIIKQIILFSNNLDEQKQFYQDVMDFELIYSSNGQIDFNVGDSILSFRYQEEYKPSHVAFNIPSNKIDEALEWLQKRVEVLADGSEAISNFESWNAKAIYFYDADKNIMEFIARKDLEINKIESFSSKQILSISEIAIATNKVESLYREINSISEIQIYSGNLTRFCALGNEQGLFIIINKEIKKWHPTEEEAYTSDFIIMGDYNFHFKEGQIILLNN